MHVFFCLARLQLVCLVTGEHVLKNLRFCSELTSMYICCSALTWQPLWAFHVEYYLGHSDSVKLLSLLAVQSPLYIDSVQVLVKWVNDHSNGSMPIQLDYTWLELENGHTCVGLSGGINWTKYKANTPLHQPQLDMKCHRQFRMKRLKITGGSLTKWW